MRDLSRNAPCPAYPTTLHYPDIDPDELAREQAAEPADVAFAWPAYLQRTLAGPRAAAPGRG